MLGDEIRHKLSRCDAPEGVFDLLWERYRESNDLYEKQDPNYPINSDNIHRYWAFLVNRFTLAMIERLRPVFQNYGYDFNCSEEDCYYGLLSLPSRIR